MKATLLDRRPASRLQGTNYSFKEEIRGGQEGQGSDRAGRVQCWGGGQRLRRPLAWRSQRYVGATASKCGTRPLTKLGLRPLLQSGEQRAYTTFLPFMHQALPAPRSTLRPRWWRLARTALPRPLSLLTALPRKPSSLGLVKKKLTQPKEWSLMPSNPQLLLRTYPKRRRYPPR